MALGDFILHLAVSENYQLHQEAYHYLNFAKHPAWGYFSAPPFIMVLSSIAVKLFGGSAFAVRLFPALASAMMVGFMGIIIKDMGGRKWAVFLGTLAFALSPAFLRIGGLFQVHSFNVMFWFFYFYLFVQMLRTENYNYWYIISFIAGLGVLNSYSMFIPLVFSIFGLLITGKFSAIFTRQFWIGLVGIAILLVPNFLWQYNHNWPILYYLQGENMEKFFSTTAGQFLSAQFIMNSPSALVWMSGLLGIMIYKPFRKYLSVVVAFVLMLVFLVYFNAKPYYMLGIYPMFFVFGAYGLELITYQNKFIMPGITAFIAGVALVFLPLSLPLLKINTMSAYCDWVKSIGIYAPFKWDDKQIHDIPQDYAKMRGWNELTEIARSAYDELAEDEKLRTAFYSSNSDIAAALNHYNRKADYPEAYSLSGSFLFWSPLELPEDLVLIVVGEPSERLRETYTVIKTYNSLVLGKSELNGTKVYVLKRPSDSFYSYYEEYRKDLFLKFYRNPVDYKRK